MQTLIRLSSPGSPRLPEHFSDCVSSFRTENLSRASLPAAITGSVKVHAVDRTTIRSSTMNEVPSSSASQEPVSVSDQRPAKRQKVAIACLPRLPRLGSRILLTFLGL